MNTRGLSSGAADKLSGTASRAVSRQQTHAFGNRVRTVMRLVAAPKMRPGSIKACCSRRIFISHSSRGSEWSVQLRHRLVEELQARNYSVFLDEYQIVEGDLWRPKVYRALTECDAAVVLLSKDSLESKWVHTECTILACRRDLHAHFNREFKLLPVLLPGVSRADLRASPPPAGRLPVRSLQIGRFPDRQTVRRG